MPPGHHGGRGLRYGLGAVKQVGETAAEIIVREREEHGAYTSLRDLLSRVDTSKVTSKQLEALAKAGAFEVFGPRESILATLPSITKALSSYKGKMTRRIKAEKATDDVSFPEIALVETFTPPPSQYLDWELEALGLFLSDHPFARAAGRIEVGTPIEEVGDKVGQVVEITGAVVALKEIITKKKKERMAIVTLGDLTGTVEAVVFPSQYRLTSDSWGVGSIVVASGKVEVREDKTQLVVDHSTSVVLDEGPVTQVSNIPERLDDIPERTARELAVRLKGTDDLLADGRRAAKLGDLVRPGRTPFRVVAEGRYGHREVISDEGATVALTDELVEKLTCLLGKDNVRVVT
jgi:DNA polymerase-3 subunit alpha